MMREQGALLSSCGSQCNEDSCHASAAHEGLASSSAAGQAALFWLGGRQVAALLQRDGLILEQVDARPGCCPWSVSGAAVQHVPFSEILCARYLPTRRYCMALPAAMRKHFLELQVLQRKQRRPCEWSVRRLELSAEQPSLVKRWVQQIAEQLAALPNRPRRLLVFVNPFGGKRKARATWDRIAAPILAAARVQCDVIETTHQGHAEEVVAGLSLQQLQQLDGLVAVGGDGLFSALLTALLQHRQLQAAMRLRLAHIPAGSTDAVACTLHGTRCPVTATLHVALGDSTALDVARLVTLPPLPALAAATAARVAAAAVAQQQQQGVARGSLQQLLQESQQQAAVAKQQDDLEQQLQAQAQAAQQVFVPQLHHFVCVANHGFLGDVMRLSERMRWMGPARYDVAGLLRFLTLRGYKATVWYKPAEDAAGTPAGAAAARWPGEPQPRVHVQAHCDASWPPRAAAAAAAHAPAGSSSGGGAGCNSGSSSGRSSVDVSHCMLRGGQDTPACTSSPSTPAERTPEPCCTYDAAASAAAAAAGCSLGATSSPPCSVRGRAVSFSALPLASAGSASSLARLSAPPAAGSTSPSIAASSGRCYSGCLLCGTAAMRRSSSRQLFAAESADAAAVAAAAAGPGAGAAASDHGSGGGAAAAAAAAAVAGCPGPGWVRVDGRFAAIMTVVTSCRSDKSRSGLMPNAHLADGRLSLVLVRARGRLPFLRFLVTLARRGVLAGMVPGVSVEHATEVQVQLDGQRVGWWNVDGELLQHSRVHVGVHAGLVDVFARGVEVAL